MHLNPLSLQKKKLESALLLLRSDKLLLSSLMRKLCRLEGALFL